ncbi:MAG: NAD(P)H-dependent oxidoreductase subunit E [Planctomycetes bacterium]|nr:NAD(P)H-dependent oxidoreductase subunit E [Planctomycetota bacterium]
MALSDALRAEFEELCTHYPERRAGLIPALHRCQDENGGWLTPEILEDLADFFGLAPVDVYGVASFYPMFRLRPVGEHVISVCHNISCALRGAEALLEHICERTGARPGLDGTSPDGRFTVLRVECQGACANAPMVEVHGEYHEDLDPAKVDRLLAELQSGAPARGAR